MGKILIIILLSLLCSEVFSQTHEELLYKAYQDSSYELLEQFLENWRLEKTPITDEEYEALTEVEKDVYDLFYTFYNPFNLKERKSVYNVIIYPKMYYKIIESLNRDSIFISILRDVYKYDLDTVDLKKYDERSRNFFITNLESSIPYIEKDSIVDFRPRVKFTNAKVLYYNEYYDSLFTKLDHNDSLALGAPDSGAVYSGGILGLYYLYPYVFFRKNIKGKLFFLTYPYVSSIVFDKNRIKAKVNYYDGEIIGYDLYKKANGKWKRIGSETLIIWD